MSEDEFWAYLYFHSMLERIGWVTVHMDTEAVMGMGATTDKEGE